MPDIRGAVALSTNYPLDKAKHGSPDLHKFGQSLLDPTFVAPVASSTTGAVGLSDEVARADHVHGLSQTTLDATTGAQTTANQALAVANGNTAGASQGATLYSQVYTPVNYQSFQPLRFSGVVCNMGTGMQSFYYIRQGQMVDIFAHWGVANDSSYPASGTMQLFVPVNLNGVSNGVVSGQAFLFDSGVANNMFHLVAVSSGAGYMVFQFLERSGLYWATNGGSSPMTWTAGDTGKCYARIYTG